MRHNQPYIHEGRVVRGGDGRYGGGDTNLTIKNQITMLSRHFSTRRFLLVVIPAVVLFVTNPSNEILPPTVFQQSSTKRSSSMSSTSKTTPLVEAASRWLMPPGTTNYGLFSIEDRFDGISLVALGGRPIFVCPFNNIDYGSICEFVADNMCHHKPLLYDRQDRAYTTHRILCLMLILSSILDFCCGPWAPPLRLFYHTPTMDAIIGTVFYRPMILHDLFYQNMTVYPALVELDKIITTRLAGNNNTYLSSLSMSRFQYPMAGSSVSFNYTLFVIVLVFVIGGGSNAIAARVGRQDPFSMSVGYSSVIAASLGYCQRATTLLTYRNGFGFINTITNNTNNKILISIWGSDITASRAYWTSAAWIVLNGQQAGTSSRQWFPRLVAWLVAGFTGLVLAQYPLQ
jgi:hypothetical protein